MAHRVMDNLDALVGIAVKIAAARPHAIPIVFFRFGFYRFAADSGDRVVASYRGHGDLARPFAILAYVSSGMELATALLRIYAALGQCFFPCLDPRAHFVRWMRMAHRHDVIPMRPAHSRVRAEVPATQVGGGGCCTGLGYNVISGKLQNFPSCLKRSLCQALRMISSASTILSCPSSLWMS